MPHLHMTATDIELTEKSSGGCACHRPTPASSPSPTSMHSRAPRSNADPASYHCQSMIASDKVRRKPQTSETELRTSRGRCLRQILIDIVSMSGMCAVGIATVRVCYCKQPESDVLYSVHTKANVSRALAGTLAFLFQILRPRTSSHWQNV